MEEINFLVKKKNNKKIKYLMFNINSQLKLIIIYKSERVLTGESNLIIYIEEDRCWIV